MLWVKCLQVRAVLGSVRFQTIYQRSSGSPSCNFLVLSTFFFLLFDSVPNVADVVGSFHILGNYYIIIYNIYNNM